MNLFEFSSNLKVIRISITRIRGSFYFMSKMGVKITSSSFCRFLVFLVFEILQRISLT